MTSKAYLWLFKIKPMIADLAGSAAITYAHLEQALQYRPKLDLI